MSSCPNTYVQNRKCTHTLTRRHTYSHAYVPTYMHAYSHAHARLRTFFSKDGSGGRALYLLPCAPSGPCSFVVVVVYGCFHDSSEPSGDIVCVCVRPSTFLSLQNSLLLPPSPWRPSVRFPMRRLRLPSGSAHLGRVRPLMVCASVSTRRIQGAQVKMNSSKT
jgi:hypothetical protein